jgi:hypothetical protein
METKIKYLKGFYVFCLAFLYALMGQSSAQAGLVTESLHLTYKLSNDSNATIRYTYFAFNAEDGYGTYDSSENGYCLENHLDPDNQRYEHTHTYNAFAFDKWGEDADGLTDGDTGLTVRAENVDWFWDQYYGFPHDSSADFSFNCFAYATDQPTWATQTGYVDWTTASTLDDATSQKKSFATKQDSTSTVVDHAVVIEETTFISGENVTVIQRTSEKMGCAGIYSRGWMPLGLILRQDQSVRKTKPRQS